MRSLVFIAALTPILLAEPVAPEKLKAAEKTFRELYGKDYDRILKSKNAAEKVAFGRKLWEIAKGTPNDPAVGVIFGDKAFPLAMSDPAGYPVALEIKQARVEPAGKNRYAQLAAVADILEKSAKAAPPDRIVAMQLIDAQRDVADAAFALNKDMEAATMLAKAKENAKLLPPAEAVVIVKELAAAKEQFDAIRRHVADARIHANVLKSDPNDARANAGHSRALIRAGKAKDAGKFLEASKNDVLVKLAETLTVTSPDPLTFGDRWKAAAEAFPADKAWFLGIARMHYEAGAAAHPKHLTATRARVLAKDLPSYTSVAVRVPPTGLVLELADESERGDAMLAAFAKTGSTGVKFTQSDHYSGNSALRFEAGRHSANWYVTTCIASPNLGQYRYARFAVKQKGGTFLHLDFLSDNVVVNSYTFGSASGGVSLGAVPKEWAMFTRDLLNEHVGEYKGVASITLKGLRVESDGDVLLDSAWLGRSLRDLDCLNPRPLD